MRFVIVLAIKEQFVNEALSAASVMWQDVFKFLQLVQVRSDLELTPTTTAPHITATKQAYLGRYSLLLAKPVDHFTKEDQQTTRLRGQLIKTATKHFVGNRVRCRNVGRIDFDVLQPPFFFEWPLMLVQQGDCPDQG